MTAAERVVGGYGDGDGDGDGDGEVMWAEPST